MRKLLIVSMLLWATPAFAQLGSVPYVYSSGTTVSSSQTNTNFSTAYALALNRAGGTMTGTLTTLNVFPATTATSDIGAILAKYRDGWFSRDVYIGRDISSTGAATFTGAITALSLSVSSGITASTGNITTMTTGSEAIATTLTVGTTLGVAGVTNLSSTLTVAGATTLLSTLSVSGAITATAQTITAGAINTTTGAISTTLSAGSFSAGSAAVSGLLTAGSETIGGTLGISGTTTAVAINTSGRVSSSAGLTVSAGTVIMQSTINAIAGSGDAMDIDIVGGTAIQFARGGVVSGSITMSGGVTAYNTTSDRRLKNDLGPTRTGLDTVLALQVRDYTMKSDFSATRHTGLMAQQVLPLVPDVVTVPSSSTGYYELDYGRLTPLLVKAIQDQQHQIDTLQMEVARLRATR